MKQKSFVLFLVFTFFFFTISGCAGSRFKTDLKNTLHPESLRLIYNTQPINFKELSKCDDLSVRFVNAETRDADMNIVPGAIFSPSWNINPRELTDDIIKYMEKSYRQCRVLPSKSSRKEIHLSLNEITGWPTGIFRFTSYSRLQINVFIPELNFKETYTLDRSSGYLYDAMAYSIHEFTWQIINDPVVQDYILCR